MVRASSRVNKGQSGPTFAKTVFAGGNMSRAQQEALNADRAQYEAAHASPAFDSGDFRGIDGVDLNALREQARSAAVAKAPEAPASSPDANDAAPAAAAPAVQPSSPASLGPPPLSAAPMPLLDADGSEIGMDDALAHLADLCNQDFPEDASDALQAAMGSSPLAPSPAIQPNPAAPAARPPVMARLVQAAAVVDAAASLGAVGAAAGADGAQAQGEESNDDDLASSSEDEADNQDLRSRKAQLVRGRRAADAAQARRVLGVQQRGVAKAQRTGSTIKPVSAAVARHTADPTLADPLRWTPETDPYLLRHRLNSGGKVLGRLQALHAKYGKSNADCRKGSAPGQGANMGQYTEAYHVLLNCPGLIPAATLEGALAWRESLSHLSQPDVARRYVIPKLYPGISERAALNLDSGTSCVKKVTSWLSALGGGKDYHKRPSKTYQLLNPSLYPLP